MTIEQALEQLMNHAQYKLNREDLTALNVIIDNVKDKPTGHWILQSDYNDKLYGWFYCSECGAYRQI